jgi:hypothetical protein
MLFLDLSFRLIERKLGFKLVNFLPEKKQFLEKFYHTIKGFYDFISNITQR